MKLLRSRALFAAYPFLPHRVLNGAAGWLSRRRRPRSVVSAAIDLWVRRGGMDLSDFEPGPFASIEDFFLRRLRPGARPLPPADWPGFVSPVDGRVVAAGALTPGARLMVKGQALSLERLLNGRLYEMPLAPFDGGRYLVIFLSPEGYHHVHAPADLQVHGTQWLPGRFFPQNEDALGYLRGVYERNERLVLRCRLADGAPFALVLVGASLVGGICVQGLPRPAFAQTTPQPCDLAFRRGAVLGHFRFGSTVVLVFPPGAGPAALPAVGAALRMGQRL